MRTPTQGGDHHRTPRATPTVTVRLRSRRRAGRHRADDCSEDGGGEHGAPCLVAGERRDVDRSCTSGAEESVCRSARELRVDFFRRSKVGPSLR